ncbi:sugar phosphate isomerase/epimerase family protein [Halalkalibacter alkaliphilus]|uniref:Sugar phosphate isomerase/epimerase n=1 Tax=Halalkalibacter alkaliphilus TaxID=2917993 RepID=A0A9X2CWX4_9BACI|nr:sugar phosphate isomerase/epimerase [Halalkalibacter alkaliphilus]MCL7749764.1 sugar phosphate isomerase/epimerase [Halalkalibacter alkaliphilus]
MNNLKYSYMTNMWGMITDFPKINNFKEMYNVDRSNVAYYMDWDKILKYHVTAGITGIELMFYTIPYIKHFFGSLKNFSEFSKERGIEQITGTFSFASGSEDKSNHNQIWAYNQMMIDSTYELGGENINIMPAGNYYGTGPLSSDQLKTAAECFNEIGRMAADKGITACIHNEFFCAINLHDHERFIELTDPEYVAYCLDTAQLALMGVDPVQFYDKYHERVKYFHLKDTDHYGVPDHIRYGPGAEFADDGTRWFWEVGGGEVDFKGLWKLLKKHDHKGWMAIESDGTPDPVASLLLSKWYIDHELSPIYN